MILVTGATGNIGSEIVRQLVQEGRRIRVLSRNPEKVSQFPKSVEFVKGDLQEPDTLKATFAGIEKAFLLAHAMELPIITRKFVEVAKKAGVKHIVLNSSSMPPKTKIGGWHLEAENILKSSGLDWTMLRPGNLVSNTVRWAEMIRSQGAVFSPGNEKTVPIDPRDVGVVAAKVLIGTGHEGKTYALTGPEALSPSEQLDCIAKAIGKTLKFVEVSIQVARANMLKSGMPELLVDAILELMRVDGPEATRTTTTVLEITGRPARNYAEWVKDHSKLFT